MGKELILAVETGGTKLQLILGDSEGQILWKDKIQISPDLGNKGILSSISESFPRVVDKAEKYGGRIGKIGVGFGGPVDYQNGNAMGSMQIDGWKNFPIKKYLEKETGASVFVYNDSDAAAWGEFCLGTGQGCHTFFYTNIGSGIGGGLILNNTLFIGQGCGSMEFGQTFVPISWKDDNPRSLEEVCSGWAIQRYLQATDIPGNSVLWELCGGHQDQITGLEFHEAINRNDTFSFQVLDRIANIFSLGLANVVNLLGPEVIAVGGGISLIGQPLIERLRYYTDRYIYKNGNVKCRIELSQLGELIVPIGVLLLTGKEWHI